jgi:hypothetical protein
MPKTGDAFVWSQEGRTWPATWPRDARASGGQDTRTLAVSAANRANLLVQKTDGTIAQPHYHGRGRYAPKC